DRVESVGGIASKQVPARRGSISVEDNRLATVQKTRELGDDFCQVSRTPHLGSGFACSIRVRRGQDARLEQIVVIVLDFSVHLVGRDVDKLADANAFGAFEQYMGAVDIR
ncbi:hypothetical protein BN1723_012060, partial [Verticillium longisporum]